MAVGVGQITDREFAEQAAELIAGLRPDMAGELRGAVPPCHDAGRTAVPEVRHPRAGFVRERGAQRRNDHRAR
ncbi:hypothetical protein, partial [Gordonia sihwensis]|uniref:hypothetical protein n=1 Tax=Gordonia sihwensis TaxID=173559 RepID=UPI0005EE6698